jgi:hypothetical protein
MAEEPIRLFARRSERYPQPNELDTARSTIEKIVEQQLPVLGLVATQAIAQFLTPGIERRREMWFKELADVVDELEDTVAGFTVESLENNERFVSATIQATRIAIATHVQEKRDMLRNGLLRIALCNGPGDDLEQTFLRAIEEFTPSHVKILYVLWAGARDLTERGLWDAYSKRYDVANYGRAVQLLFPEISDVSLMQFMMRDLSMRGFSTIGDPGASFPQGSIVTNIGIGFLNFVLAPKKQENNRRPSGKGG